MKALTPFAAAAAFALGSVGAMAAPGGHGVGGPPAVNPGQSVGIRHDNPTGRADAEHSQAHAQAAQAASNGRTVDELLSNNAKLAGKIHDLTGADASAACGGFTNLGGCVSAAHVSKNLDISFDALKAKMTGTSAVDLGTAIHELKPDADSRTEVRKARKQADEDVGDSGKP
jgi:hypothetical protein